MSESTSDPDVIVAGLGAAGSACAYHLARRGLAVLGLDAHQPPHDLGSHGGRTRIIREAYFEGEFYVPFVHRAFDLWRELEAETGETLFQRTGALLLGPHDGGVVPGARDAARQHGLPHEDLTREDIARRFPAFAPPAGGAAVLEPRAGYLRADRCIELHLAGARAAGATLHTGTPLTQWRADGDDVVVTTPSHEYRARHLVLAMGAWLGALAGMPLPLTVTRQPVFWFDPADRDAFRADRFPVFLVEYGPGRYFYGLPYIDGEHLKLGSHHLGELADPSNLRRSIDDADVDEMRDLLRRFLPGADGRLVESAVCLYTSTPDGHFILDRHPAHPQVLVLSPCSGHGFKFTSAVGELVAQWIMGQPSPFELGAFRHRT